MAAVPRLRVMFSSRALSPVFGGERLTDLRLELKARIEGIRIGEHQLFEVWIHEDDPEPAGKTILEGSLEEIAKADIVLVLYTGEAGSADRGSEIGICHAELQEALTHRRDVVSVISLEPAFPAVEHRDKVFQQYVAARRLIHTRVADRDALFDAALRLVLQRAVELAKRGARPAGRRVDQGAALDWARLDLPRRAEAMRAALVEALDGEVAEDGVVLSDLGLPGLAPARLLLRVEAIPAALGVAAARERVGQPFYQDHDYAALLAEADSVGPVHVIACHRGVTESQALKLLGTSNAVAVASEFGVFAAEDVMQTQLVLLSHCVEEGAVRLGLRRFREWLEREGEAANLLRRARARRGIVEAIARGRASL